jgi:uncharacterized membrane protein
LLLRQTALYKGGHTASTQLLTTSFLLDRLPVSMNQDYILLLTAFCNTDCTVQLKLNFTAVTFITAALVVVNVPFAGFPLPGI